MSVTIVRSCVFERSLAACNGARYCRLAMEFWLTARSVTVEVLLDIAFIGTVVTFMGLFVPLLVFAAE